jgi:hypothetical protein
MSCSRSEYPDREVARYLLLLRSIELKGECLTVVVAVLGTGREVEEKESATAKPLNVTPGRASQQMHACFLTSLSAWACPIRWRS